MTLTNWRTVTAVGVTLLFWSSAFAGIRAALQGGYSPGHVVLLRFLSASIVFLIYAAVKGIRLPRRNDVPKIAALGFIGISLYHTALTFGETAVQAGTASLIIAVAPAFTAIIAAFALRERLTRIGWLGIVIGFIGTGLITFGSGEAQGFTHGALLILISAASAAVFFVYQKPLYHTYRPLELTAYFTWFGTLPMLLFVPGLWRQMSQVPVQATISAVYIGIFPAAIAYVAWGYALSKARASSVTSALYLNPILAISIAWIWLGEFPKPVAIIGGLVAIVGVVAVNVWGKAKTAPAYASVEEPYTREIT